MAAGQESRSEGPSVFQFSDFHSVPSVYRSVSLENNLVALGRGGILGVFIWSIGRLHPALLFLILLLIVLLLGLSGLSFVHGLAHISLVSP